MIQITDKRSCCGCSACVQRCPKQCISLKEDDEGFLYPIADVGICINCGLCEKACPIITPQKPAKSDAIYAAVNPDSEIRRRSSSGGVFYMLACQILQKGGIVFGVCFDKEWNVVHKEAETEDDVKQFLGSKYVQSYIGDSYIKVEHYIKEGRNVLFSGTACQIAGLYAFLRHEYDNLITIDVLCHGVPSPKVWRDYLGYECVNHDIALSEITSISFRDKKKGWRRFSMDISTEDGCIVSEPLDVNLFLKGFLRDLYLRPSCHDCKFRCGKSHSDITIADYWGIWNHHTAWDDDKGTSLILANTAKGNNLLNTIGLKKIETSYEDALSCNPVLEKSVNETKYRQEFWRKYPVDGIAIVDSICQKMQPSIFKRLIYKAKSIIKV